MWTGRLVLDPEGAEGPADLRVVVAVVRHQERERVVEDERAGDGVRVGDGVGRRRRAPPAGPRLRPPLPDLRPAWRRRWHNRAGRRRPLDPKGEGEDRPDPATPQPRRGPHERRCGRPVEPEPAVDQLEVLGELGQRPRPGGGCPVDERPGQRVEAGGDLGAVSLERVEETEVAGGHRRAGAARAAVGASVHTTAPHTATALFLSTPVRGARIVVGSVHTTPRVMVAIASVVAATASRSR